MSLLAKIRNCGVLLMCLALSYSCEEKGSFGIATDDVAPVEFISEDIDINSSIVQLDSVITAFQGRFMAGELRDSPWGNITSTGYIGINGRTDNIPEFDDEATYDSMKVEFQVSFLHDSSFTNRDLNIELYSITETFEDTIYISKNSLQYSQDLFASGSLVIEDLDSSYAIDASDVWGQEFFNGLINGTAEFESQDNFEAYFPGLAVRANNSHGNIFGLRSGINFRVILYYSEPNEDNTDRVQREFELNGFSMPYFFGVEYDRSGSAFAAVIDDNTEYDNTGSLGVHSGSGLVTKVNLSNLENFSDNNPGVIINSAELIVGPVTSSGDQFLPSSLIVYMTDERNTRIQDGNSFRTIQRDGANQLGSSNPVRLFYNTQTSIYSASITSFFQDYYENNFRRDEFFIYPSDMNSTFRGFTVDRDKVIIKIYYSTLQ